MGRTRIIHLRSGVDRGDAINEHTLAGGFDPVARVRAPPSFEAAFKTHYDEIRAVVERPRCRGVAMVAVDHLGVAATGWVAAKPDRINTAIIGRHGRSDLFLPGDRTLALRHMVVILHPILATGEVRYRVVDLRTSSCFADEQGRDVEALEAEGPIFVRLASYVVLFLPTEEDGYAWPDNAKAAWKLIPERVYLDDAPAEPDRHRRHRARPYRDIDVKYPARDPGQTDVQVIRGPAFARRRLAADSEEGVGELLVESKRGESRFLIGSQALREGVLLGRYGRCDNEGLPVLTDSNISRVHLLLIEVDGDIYAVDTASTNGIWNSGAEIRANPLEFGDKLTLGRDLATVRWQALH